MAADRPKAPKAIVRYSTTTSMTPLAYAYARATAQMTTADSMLSLKATWFFPQPPDSADFVIVRYTISNRSASPVSDIAVGLYADLDIIAASHLQETQDDPKASHGYYYSDLNLIYQYGYDSIGHVPYNLYTMVHGRSEQDCRLAVDELAAVGGLGEHVELWTTREYKKRRVRLFTPEEEAWERKRRP